MLEIKHINWYINCDININIDLVRVDDISINIDQICDINININLIGDINKKRRPNRWH